MQRNALAIQAARTTHQYRNISEENVYGTCYEATKLAKNTLLINGIQLFTNVSVSPDSSGPLSPSLPASYL